MASRPEMIDLEAARLYMEEARAQFVDVRPLREYRRSRQRIPGAIHIDPGSGAKETDALLDLPREKLIVAYCDEPHQAASAELARRVRELGMGDGCALEGGFRAWREAGFPTEAIPSPSSAAENAGTPPRHVVERTADGVNLVIQARSLPALFREATLGLAEALGVPDWRVESTEHVCTVRARDAEALLLLWLIDLRRRSADEQRLFTKIAIVSVSEEELRARIRGTEVAEWLLDPRVDLLPQVRLERSGAAFEATVALDGRDLGGPT